MTSTSPHDSASARDNDRATRTPTHTSARAPRDFAQLARRISSRTTDLLAVALVAVLLLSLGVQATRWWRAKPPQVSATSTAGSPLAVWDDLSGLSLEFSNGQSSLHRESISGDEDAATKIAAQRLHHALDSASPGNLPSIDPAEQQWLDRLPDRSTDSLHERGDIFVLGGPWPCVVATMNVNVDGGGDAIHPGRRIIGWALALPQPHDRWTLYVTERRTEAANDDVSQGNIPLPANATRRLIVRSAAGGFLTFRSASSPRRCREDWDRRLVDAGWARAGDWSFAGPQARATFVHKLQPDSHRLDVLISSAPDGAAAGAGDWSILSDSNTAP